MIESRIIRFVESYKREHRQGYGAAFRALPF